MPKASKNKYYAVKLGREGPKIYNTWDEVSVQVNFKLNVDFRSCSKSIHWKCKANVSYSIFTSAFLRCLDAIWTYRYRVFLGPYTRALYRKSMQRNG